MMTPLRVQILSQQIALARKLAAEWPIGKMRTKLEDHALECAAELASDVDSGRTVGRTKANDIAPAKE